MKDDNLLNVYNEYMELTGKLLNDDVAAIEVAPIMIKLGLELYKTVMSPDEYDKMVDFISDHRGDIRDLKMFMPELH